MRERWKLVNFDPRYKVSNQGNVFTIVRNRLLIPTINKEGYAALRIGKKGMRVHRLVALHFIPNPKNKPEVNHLNGIKNDNRKVNLCWATPSENVAHSYRTGLTRSRKGIPVQTADSRRRISESKFKKIIDNRSGFVFSSIESAAISLGVHRSTLSKVLNGHKTSKRINVKFK